jgi:hypothetical protein
MASTQRHGDYSDPFSFPNPHNGGFDDLNHEFLHNNERPNSMASSQQHLEPEDHEYHDGPSQFEGSQKTLVDSTSGFERSGKYQDLG